MAEGGGWYEVVPGSNGLQQGDVLWSCPIIVPAPELTFPLRLDVIPAVIQRFDIIVATQSCDIKNDKVEEVVVCAHWDLNVARSMDAALSKSGVEENISKGRMPRYTFLEASDLALMGLRIVDLGRIFTLPRPFIEKFAATQSHRLRLKSPYREHFAQRFGLFFMRVGLP
jgi:hypothetical protein